MIDNFNEIISKSPKIDKINWWSLPEWINLELKQYPLRINKFIDRGFIRRINTGTYKLLY